MAVKDDFLGYGEEQCKFSFHSHPLSRVMYMDCFWLSLSLLVESTLWVEGYFKKFMSSLISFIGIITKTKQNIVVLFVLSFGQAGCQTGP